MITTGSYRKRMRTDGSYYWQITIELPKDPITGKRVRKYRITCLCVLNTEENGKTCEIGFFPLGRRLVDLLV